MNSNGSDPLNPYFASAVMIGAASEKVLYLLMDAVHRAHTNPTQKSAVQNAIERRGLPAMFQRLREAIDQAKSVHTRLVHSGGTCCVFLGSDFFDRCGDRRFVVEA